ncbi:MAG: Gfo/Idh/MocA family oxidoreductase [Kordiimonadaceae bacterium]|nr:Gfo/Idh/MocA family oxidoreductase [Kordiimonadaceae bacterium]
MEVSRRNFNFGAAVMAAAGVVMLGQKANAQSKKKIKLGLIGCGGRGLGAAVQALNTAEDVELVAMADLFEDRATKGRAQLIESFIETPEVGEKMKVDQDMVFHGFDGYKEVLKHVDAVILATPPAFRPEHFEAVVAADKHAFVEKPLATDAPGIRRVLKAAKSAKEKKLNVVVGLQRHYQAIYTGWVDKIHDGAIGDIIHSRVYWNGGGVWEPRMERGKEKNELEYQLRNWYYYTWVCGDHITEQHIHNLDVGNWVNKGYPVTAYGQGGRQARIDKRYGDIFDHHSVEFEYENGAIMSSRCRHFAQTGDLVTEKFHGTKGTAPEPGLILDAKGNTLHKHRRSRGEKDPYQVEHDVLWKAVSEGRYEFADAENGAYATLTTIMGRMATYSGQTITWDQALNSEHRLMPETMNWDTMPPTMPDADGVYPHAVPGKTSF